MLWRCSDHVERVGSAAAVHVLSEDVLELVAYTIDRETSHDGPKSRTLITHKRSGDAVAAQCTGLRSGDVVMALSPVCGRYCLQTLRKRFERRKPGGGTAQG